MISTLYKVSLPIPYSPLHIPITHFITNLITSTESPPLVSLARSSPHHPPHAQRSLRSRARPNPHPSRHPQEDHQLHHHRLQQHHPNKPMVSELRSHGTNAHAAGGAPPRGAERPRLQREAAVGAGDLGGLGGGQDPDEPVVSGLAVRGAGEESGCGGGCGGGESFPNPSFVHVICMAGLPATAVHETFLSS